MRLFTSKNHIVPTLMLLTVAVLPVSPLATNSAYGDIETSLGNRLAAGEWEQALTDAPQLFRVQLSEPVEVVAEIVDDEVLGTTTEETTTESLKVEVSEEPLQVDTGSTTPEEPKLDVEVSDEPLEVVDPAEEPTDESEPEKEEAPAEVTPEPAPAPVE